MGMSRWKPDAQTRLVQAALELYGERGFEQTTVAEIAQRAGLTERTYFRHFADKREVLFGGSTVFEETLIHAIANAPDVATPIDAVVVGLDAVAEAMFPPERHDYARRRQAAIMANAGLQEREQSKFASLVAALVVALGQRGVDEPTARLTAEVGVVIFKVAFERWVDGDQHLDLSQLIQESLRDVRGVTAGEGSAVGAAA
ncbi:MAG: Transcriptional regulator, AcrR family [uncultured Thermomicrobiales bacterium]|uniref:Transcriptional regulator, AcrR family n=1 Tax=uncultured Thermomicrobiales bacterium TaxID=1645740 RepID=A0A6J4VFV7_9BACT|nr:MAG: Transcriptional regulator, AcrR family [uncultured Thermomicrobiales bacterium]